MGSSGEESKASFLYDTSPSQPLLPKHPSPPPPPQPPAPSREENNEIEGDSNQYPPIVYNHGPRYFQDLPFLFIFIFLVLLTFGFGIFSIAHHNRNSSKVKSYTYDKNTTSCVKSSLGLVNHHPESNFLELWIGELLQIPPQLKGGVGSSFLKDLVWTLVFTLLISGPFVVGLLWLLRNYTKQVVYASIPFFVVIPAFLNVFWFVECTISDVCRDSFELPYRILLLLFGFAIIGIIVWIIVVNWHRIELTVRIVGTASEALWRNMGLFAVLPSLSFALLVYFVPIIAFLVFSGKNGKIVPNPKVEVDGYSCGGSTGVQCCIWKLDSWVPAYYVLAIITMIWSAAVKIEAQVYILSGTIAQWYFTKEGSTPRRSIRSSMRNAFGPSFGTICFSGLIIGAVRVVRAAVDGAKREGASGIFSLVLRCCVNFVISVVDFVNKFTINFAAITGESYCSSAKMTYELLRRNLLSAVFVETVSTRILVGIIFVLSALYTIVVCAVLKGVSALGSEAYVVAALAWVLLLVVLGFFVHVLDNVIDTVYVCYAIDRDKGEVCKQEVHEVYVLLPISRNDRPSLATRTPLIV